MSLRTMKWRVECEERAGFAPNPGARRPAGLLTFFDEDMRPARDLNDWLNVLASEHSSETTWNTYAREVARFANFLSEQFDATLLDRRLLSEGDDMLRVYHRRLIRPDERDDSLQPVGDAKSTLAKRRAALLKFYRWAVEDGRLEKMPFRLVTVHTRFGSTQTLAGLRGGRRTSAERMPLPGTQIERFVRVGLLGQRPDGAADPAFLGFLASQRNAAGVGLSLAAGLRHAEVLSTTVFEVARPHPDGFTPIGVADQISKGEHGRQVVAISKWLELVHRYIVGDRRAIARRATWQPQRPIIIDPGNTSRFEVTFTLPNGIVMAQQWRDIDLTARRRMILPGGGSPLLLLNHRAANGAPLTGTDALNQALRAAAKRCQAFWPELDWSKTMHHLRHTYATELTLYLRDAEKNAELFRVKHDRSPIWRDLLLGQDSGRIVQESMGHSGPETTQVYAKEAFWSLLLSVNADPMHNPAIRRDTN